MRRMSFNVIWVAIAICIYILLIITTYAQRVAQEDKPYSVEAIQNADYVMNTSDGRTRAIEYSTIVDMDNGYQYIVFEVDGQYLVSPRIGNDGTVYKTVE